MSDSPRDEWLDTLARTMDEAVRNFAAFVCAYRAFFRSCEIEQAYFEQFRGDEPNEEQP